MTGIVRIDVDGTVTRLPDPARDFLEVCVRELAPFGGYSGPTPWGDVIERVEPSVDIVTGHRGPEVRSSGGVLVLAVHEWGRLKGLQVNVKGWALYGRSPLVGPVFAKNDEDDPLDEAWIDWVCSADMVSADLLRHMKVIAADEGCVWL